MITVLDPAGPPRTPELNVEINVGKSCNSKCVFCLDGTPTQEDRAFMSWEHMKAELARWRRDGYTSVGFLGGEPSVYPHITGAVAHAAELGFERIALATNVMRLSREPFVDELVAAGLSRVTVSMHAHTAELEDRLTGVPGSFAKKRKAIDLLLEHRRRGALRHGVSVNVVLNAWNYPHLLKMMRFFLVEVGLDDMRVNFIRPEGRAEGSVDLTPTLTEVIPLLGKAIALNELHFRKVFTFGGIPLCVLPAELLSSPHLMVSYAGDVYRDLATDCSVASEGYEDGISKIEGGRARFNWQSRKRLDLKHAVEACNRCEASDLCEGVWREYLDIYGESEFSPLSRDEGALVRSQPRLKTPPRPSQKPRPRVLPLRRDGDR